MSTKKWELLLAFLVFFHLYGSLLARGSASVVLLSTGIVPFVLSLFSFISPLLNFLFVLALSSPGQVHVQAATMKPLGEESQCAGVQ